MPTLGNKVIDSLPAPAKGYSLVWDDKLRGFGIRVNANGHKHYIVQYRTQGGISRRHTIGQHGPFTPTEARKEAQQLLATIAKGGDPEGERQKKINADTVEQLCIQYMEKHAKVSKKPISIVNDQRLIDKFILPHMGNKKIADVSRNDIHQLHYSLRKTPYQANRVIEVVSKMFNLAESWGLRPDHSNPTYHVKAYPEKARERFLTSEEITRLNNVLHEAEVMQTESAHVVAAFRLLILTGCRLGEIQSLKWSYVDFENRCLRLPDSKTGAKVVQLNGPTLEILQKLERLPDNPYVIVGNVEGQNIYNMQKPWRRIRKAAGLEDVRIHDLRHTFASVAIGMGEGLSLIGKLLGHAHITTTQRYAHLADDPQKAASERIGAVLANMMQAKTAEMLQFPNNAV